MERALEMWRFILRENVARYRTQLDVATDGHRRQVLRSLLQAAELELAELDEASARARAAKDGQFASLLELLLTNAIKLHSADFGNIQLYEPEIESLLIGAQLNFRKPFLDHFAVVTANDGSACGDALARRCSVWLEDVADEPMFAANLDIARETGFRAVQSTPLIASGRLLGVLSTHFRLPRRWSPEDKVRSDAYAHYAGSVLAAELPLLSGQRIDRLPRRWSPEDKVRSDAYAHYAGSVLAAELPLLSGQRIDRLPRTSVLD